MKNRLYYIVTAVLSLTSTIIAQNPPSMPSAPEQGPIIGISWVLIAGALLFAYKIKNNK